MLGTTREGNSRWRHRRALRVCPEMPPSLCLHRRLALDFDWRIGDVRIASGEEKLSRRLVGSRPRRPASALGIGRKTPSHRGSSWGTRRGGADWRDGTDLAVDSRRPHPRWRPEPLATARARVRGRAHPHVLAARRRDRHRVREMGSLASDAVSAPRRARALRPVSRGRSRRRTRRSPAT